eukprot:2487130-Pyramimonas_sp.AAC.1
MLVDCRPWRGGHTPASHPNAPLRIVKPKNKRAGNAVSRVARGRGMARLVVLLFVRPASAIAIAPPFSALLHCVVAPAHRLEGNRRSWRSNLP